MGRPLPNSITHAALLSIRTLAPSFFFSTAECLSSRGQNHLENLFFFFDAYVSKHTHREAPTFTHTSSSKPLKPSVHQSLSQSCLFVAFNETLDQKVDDTNMTHWCASLCVCVWVETGIKLSIEENETTKNLPVFTLRLPGLKCFTYFFMSVS